MSEARGVRGGGERSEVWSEGRRCGGVVCVKEGEEGRSEVCVRG